jgi:uncharacterized protein YjbI with pentapeptide repeats/beta-lactamase regulating signal transducer with metallopeptidase domain
MTEVPGTPEIVARTVVMALAWSLAGSALLAAFVALAIRATNASATTRHVLWWLALAGSAALPCASVASSLGRIEHHSYVVSTAREPGERASDRGPRRAASSAPERVTRTVEGNHPARDGRETDRTAGFALPDAMRSSIDAAANWPHAAEAVVVLWIGIAAAGSISLAAGLASLRRIKNAAEPLADGVQKRLRRWRHSSRNGRSVTLRVSNEIDVPVAVGFRTPTILLPSRLIETDALAEIGDLDQIVMHEYAHLDRYDDWTNLAQRAIERIFWFNPVIAFLATRIALEREIACDDWVIAQTGHAHRYATCLWKLVEATRLPTRRIFAPGALFTPRQISIRIEQLLDSRRNALPRLSPLGALATAIAAVTLIVAQSARAPAIAIDDVLVAPPVAAAAPATRDVVNAAPIARQTPAPAAPAAPLAPVATLRLHRVPVEATPEAIARAVATAVGASARAVVRTTVARTPTGPNSYADEIGIDVARQPERVVADTGGGDAADSFPHSCQGCDLHGADLHGRDLRGATWVGANLQGADLRHADLRGANLMGANLSDARLDGADFTNARLTGVNLGGATVAGARFDGANIDGVDFGAALGKPESLRVLVDGCMGCDLHGYDLHGRDLRGIRLMGANLSGADLRGADLRNARLEGVNLRGAMLKGADLRGARLDGCSISATELLKADTRGARINTLDD